MFLRRSLVIAHKVARAYGSSPPSDHVVGDTKEAREKYSDGEFPKLSK